MSGWQAWLAGMQKWWDGLASSVREAIIVALVLVTALVVGKIVGALVKAVSKGLGADEVFKTPWSQTSLSRPSKTPSDAIGYLCVGTLWAGVSWWLAARYQLTDIANAIRVATGRVWILAVVFGFAVGLSNWLMRSLLELLRSPTVKDWSEKLMPSGREQISDTVVRAFAFLVYGFLLLFVLLVATDLFGMNITAEAIKALWELTLRLIIAAIALGVGWLGVRWLEKLREFPELAQPPPTLVQQLARLGIVGVSLLLVLILLTGGSSALIALLIVALVALFILPLRDYIPDLWAGLMLKLHNVREVVIDGKQVKLMKIGALACDLNSGDSQLIMRNREVLDAFLKGAK
jgi:ABC-type multidrug transport system fused ATPase/permease subunit